MTPSLSKSTHCPEREKERDAIITNMVKKVTQGRKKIEIKKIEETNNRQVTFSKRRSGLFKKASELCVLTGAEIAIMVHSPGGRVFAFGHPTSEHVIDRYLNGGTSCSSKSAKTLPKNTAAVNEFNQHYAEMSKELEEENKRRNVIQELKMVNDNGVLWWEAPIDGEMTLEELCQYAPSIEELKKKVLMRADELMMIKSSSLSVQSLFDVNQTPNQVFGLGNYENIEYTSSSNPVVPLGFDIGHGKI